MAFRKIPFNQPAFLGEELQEIQTAIENAHLSGNGPYSKRCSQLLEENLGAQKVLLTTSCTSALEMAGLILNLKPGDEVIMPSYTFVSTANAVVLRGCVPVFVDIDPDDLCIDVGAVEAAITEKTRAVMPVHYAGISCPMDRLMQLADERGIAVVEDAAQGLGASWDGKPLGSFGDLAALSFHETKNVISGEGGALIINDEKHMDRAEIIWEKGTDRASFFRGEVDKYTWRDVGSSFLPSEIIAAYLSVQLERSEEITADRLNSWNHYHQLLEPLEAAGHVKRPIIPARSVHNAHIYHLRVRGEKEARRVWSALRETGIDAVTHYVPLHSSPAGKQYGRSHGSLAVTDEVAATLIRLPLWYGITEEMVEHTCSILKETLS